MSRVLTLFALVVIAVVGIGSGAADAHSGKQSYLYVSVFDDGVDGRVEIPVAQLSTAIDVDIPNDVTGARSAMGDLTEPIRTYVRANTSLGDESGPWQIDFADRLQILPTENGPYVVVEFVIDESFETAPESLVVDFSVIIESDPEKDALLLIEDDWASATFENGSDPLLGFSVGMTRQTVELGGASTLESMGDIRGIGTDSLRIGIDLMLIVVAVALTAAMALAAPSQTLTGIGVARRGAVLAIVLAAAATPTLWLTGLGVIPTDERATGIAVAAALLVAALLAISGRVRPLSERALVTTVAAVGVVQGLGFGQAFVVSELDRRRPIPGLIAFQFGTLVGSLVIVACVVVPMLLLRRTRFARPFALVLGIALVGYALAWLGERVLSQDWPIEEVANPLRVWPRNLWFVASAIAIAAIVRRFDRTPTPPEEPNTP